MCTPNKFVFKGFLCSSSSDKRAEKELGHVSIYIPHIGVDHGNCRAYCLVAQENMADRITQLQDALNQVILHFITLACYYSLFESEKREHLDLPLSKIGPFLLYLVYSCKRPYLHGKRMILALGSS